MYQLTRWLVPALDRFPRRQEFLLGDRIRTAAPAGLETPVEATFTRNRGRLLDRGDVDLDKLRLLLRLSKELGYLDARRPSRADSADGRRHFFPSVSRRMGARPADGGVSACLHLPGDAGVRTLSRQSVSRNPVEEKGRMKATIRAVRRATGGAFVIRPEWRRVAQWAGVLAAAAVLAGCVPGGTKPPSETQLVAVAHNPAPPFSAGVFPTTAPPHRLGDEVGFALTTDTAGYGHLYLLNASGTVVALVENLPVAAGVQATFPVPGGAYRLRASPPGGDRAGAVSGDARTVCRVQRRRGGERAGDARARSRGVRAESERGDGEACVGWLGAGGGAPGGAAGDRLMRAWRAPPGDSPVSGGVPTRAREGGARASRRWIVHRVKVCSGRSGRMTWARRRDAVLARGAS